MKVDMSAEAVTNRLKRASQLRRLCLELGKMVEPVVSEANNSDRGAQPPITSANKQQVT